MADGATTAGAWGAVRAMRADAGTALVEGTMVDRQPRCWRCTRKLAEYAARPWRFTCARCKATNASPQTDAAAAKYLTP